jgi:hypothetical protein
MPLRLQDSKNHKNMIINKLHLVKLSVLSALVVKNGFSEWTQNFKFKIPYLSPLCKVGSRQETIVCQSPDNCLTIV